MQISLIYGAREMQNEKTIEDLNIEDGFFSF